VNATLPRKLRRRKRRIEQRLGPVTWPEQDAPMFSARNLQYDLAERTRGSGRSQPDCIPETAFDR